MNSWNEDELDRIGRALELTISSEREDGTFRPPVIIWSVRVGDDIYVRSAHGVDNPWFRRALLTHLGRISAGGVEHEVAFVEASDAPQEAIDAAYHAKYVGGNAQYLPPVVGEHSYAGTLLLTPR